MTTLTIAAKDIRSYFSSLKGWAIFWFALFFMAIFFWSFVSTFLELQQQAPMMGGSPPSLNQLLTAIFHNLHFILLLVVPAITMASFAEEKKSQTIRLLQSSPISTTQIVLGKFLGAAILLGLVIVASTVFPLFVILYGNPDPGPVISSYVGIFLLMMAQIAFGMWVSSLCENQFMAFLFTMGGVFLLMILNWIAPNLTTDTSLEAIAKYLASTTHLDNLFKGLITISDVTYFVAFTSIFLFLTHFSIDSLRWR